MYGEYVLPRLATGIGFLIPDSMSPLPLVGEPPLPPIQKGATVVQPARPLRPAWEVGRYSPLPDSGTTCSEDGVVVSRCRSRPYAFLFGWVPSSRRCYTAGLNAAGRKGTTRPALRRNITQHPTSHETHLQMHSTARRHRREVALRLDQRFL